MLFSSRSVSSLVGGGAVWLMCVGHPGCHTTVVLSTEVATSVTVRPGVLRGVQPGLHTCSGWKPRGSVCQGQCIVLEHRSACETPIGLVSGFRAERLHACLAHAQRCTWPQETGTRACVRVCVMGSMCMRACHGDVCARVRGCIRVCVCVRVASHARSLRTIVPLEGSPLTARQLARRRGLWPGRSLLHPLVAVSLERG